MSRPRFLAPCIATLTTALLVLSAAPSLAAPGSRPGNSGYSRPGNSGFSRPGNSGYYRPGNSGYYPGYFSNAYRGAYPFVGVGFYGASYASPSATYIYSAAPAVYVAPGAADAGQPQPPPTTDGPASVGVHVPPDADVWFNGDPTRQTGELREFATPTLPASREFQYDVRARWFENGKPVEQSRTISVRANQRSEVDFTQPELLKSPSIVPPPK